MQITLHDKAAFDELYGLAAMLANLEGFGSGAGEATLAEIQAAGTAMLNLLDGEAA